jgi:hypothetical protein
MLQQALGNKVMGRTKCFFEWFSRFKAGQTSVEDDERSGCLATSKTGANIEKVREAVHEDRRQSIQDIANAVGISYGSCKSILTENFNMRRVAAKFVPCLLTQDQKNRRLEVCHDLKKLVEDDPDFLSKVITGDETWIYGYDPETIQQPSQWQSPHSPRPKKQGNSRGMSRACSLFCLTKRESLIGNLFHKGLQLTKFFYIEVMKRLREDVRRKRPALWASNDWFIHHDKAPAHTALSVQRFLATNNMAVVPYPPYSPDLALCDFFLSPKIKMTLKGRHFNDVEEIQAESQAALDAVQKKEFQKCFQKWENRCIRPRRVL